MSYFRPGGRNKTHLVRPMVELQASTGFETSRKIMRWGAKNSLMNDFHVKRPHRHAKWRFHEPQWVQRKRWIREYWTRRWKKEVRNTADMALWWKFRENATESYDKEQYEQYLQQREDKRLKQLIKESKYQSWSINDCIEDRDYISYTKSLSEQEYLNSIKPETFLSNLRSKFLEKQENKTKGYQEWKNKYDPQIMQRSQYKKLKSNQNIKIKGIDDVTGYDWINFNAKTGFNDDRQGLMLMDDDPEYLNKYQLIQQSNKDKEMLKGIMNEQGNYNKTERKPMRAKRA